MYFFPLSDNVNWVDSKGTMIRFTEVKHSIYAGCCDVWWENTSYFPKLKALLQLKPSSCRAENEKLLGKGNLNSRASEDDLQKHTLLYEIKQKTEKKNSCNGVGQCSQTVSAAVVRKEWKCSVGSVASASETRISLKRPMCVWNCWFGGFSPSFGKSALTRKFIWFESFVYNL